MSFCDSKTGQSIGVCVVQVTARQAEEAIAIHQGLNPDGNHPGDEWTIAAIGKSVLLGCNPGGDVAITQIVDPDRLPADLPRNTLISHDELTRKGWV